MYFVVAILHLVCISSSHAAQIYRYDVPIVTIRTGNSWIINGNLKLVHIINLDEYKIIADNITRLVQKHMPPGQNLEIIRYHLTQAQERLFELEGIKNRPRRSIDWIGSAWKWVAGSPDATDWNTILNSQNKIISNNNEQYMINANLMNTTSMVIQKTNELITKMNEISKGKESEQLGQVTINQVLILKDTINEVVRACQLAKSGIINTNLLERTEVENVLTEMETLPYANAVEAIEYGTPSIYTNGSLLLYTLSIPKLGRKSYHQIIARATIRDDKQIDLGFNEILISQNETFGIKTPCLYINKLTVCRQSSLSKLDETTCIPRLLKGGNATCQYRVTGTRIVEMITDDTIFLTNYVGVIKISGNTRTLNGTYLIQLINETIIIGNEAYSSSSTSTLQPLPPILSSIDKETLLVDINQVHNISLQNVENLEYLGAKLNFSFGSYIGIVLIMGICIGLLWYKITRRLNLPTIKMSQSNNPIQTHSICGTQIFKEGGVNDSTDTANKLSLAESALNQ